MSEAGSSLLNANASYSTGPGTTKPNFNDGLQTSRFEIFEWYPAHESCQRYFLDHAQHDGSVQAVCALINIALPHQWLRNPINSSLAPNPFNTADRTSTRNSFHRSSKLDESPRPLRANWVSLVPYIRRLIVTGFDRDVVLHGFFGDDWRSGVGPIQECERRNYLFAAKSGGWAKVKSEYDMGPQETVPFLQPPQNVQVSEIENAEKLWSQWLAMEDWAIGPRAPESMGDYSRNESHQNTRPS